MGRKTFINLNYDEIARQILLDGNLDLDRHEAQYRKNKSKEDIDKARVKAIKHGYGRTELELSMLAIYLKTVLKRRK